MSGQAVDPVPRSAELFAPVGPDVELCYQTFGNPDDEAMLLVMGLGGPMTWYDEPFCEMLARAGYFVIRFDNRDAGRSSRGKGRVTRPMLLQAFAGRAVRAPYTLADMASDSFGLLDHLGVEAAHLVGVSMGGMIVQTMAVERPRRVLSLTSIMSSPGKRSVGWQDPKLLPTLIAPRKPTKESYVAMSARLWSKIGSPGFPTESTLSEQRAADTYDRGVSASGTLRQMVAILSQPNRAPALRSLSMPTLVIHGDCDRMVHVSGGRATAQAVPGAELLLIKGMGHDLPASLWPVFAEAITRVAGQRRLTT